MRKHTGAFVDLSHAFEDGMPGFELRREDGTIVRYSARIRPFLTHAQSAPLFGHRCSFEVTEISFQTSIGTYLDSPYHRHPDGRDIAALTLDDVILPGLVVDARGRDAFDRVGPDALPPADAIRGHAVLFCFGWDRLWGTSAYLRYPFIARETIDALLDAGAALVGVDTPNVDDSRDLDRPAHTHLLAADVLIVENLTNLDRVIGRTFRFFAVPWRARKVAALPVRAFAEIQIAREAEA